jgi:PKD repeat protein
VLTGQNVTFTATTTGASTYQWNFGNGTSATGISTFVSYTEPGVYVVSLMVTSPPGCSSTKTENITVNAITTGISNISDTGSLKIWSHDNKVYVDLRALQLSDASIIIYDILGQEISNDKVVNNVVYQKEIDNIEAAYMIVVVRNANEITTRKVFINNIR